MHAGRVGTVGRMRVPYGAVLNAKQRLAVARVSGVGRRWAVGALQDHPQADAIAAIRQVTRDPAVLGVALGSALAAAELDGYSTHKRLAGLYRLAGADEQVAAISLDWHRARRSTGGARS